jgi:hypothetical protein
MTVPPPSDYVVVRCESEHSILYVSLSTDISSIKTVICARHHFPHGVRLVFQGRLLDSKSTLESSGIPFGGILVAIPEKFDASLHIFPLSGEAFKFDCPITSHVSDLRSAIALRLDLSPEQIHLVSRGRVLEDFFTISFYELPPNAAVYVVPAKHSSTLWAKPLLVLDALRSKISEFAHSAPLVQRRLASEITELIEDPVLQSYARICPEARTVVDDARILLEAAESPRSAAVNLVVASINDQMINQFETTPGGLKILREALLKEPAERPSRLSPARLDFEPRIAEEPLPVWWNPHVVDPGRIHRRMRERHSPTKERWSNEINALKRMGFGDESVILRALKEASGNIQRAVKLLLRNPPDACE